MCELDADSDSVMQLCLCINRVQTTASPLPTQVRNNVGTAVKACGFDSCSCCNSLTLPVTTSGAFWSASVT